MQPLHHNEKGDFKPSTPEHLEDSSSLSVNNKEAPRSSVSHQRGFVHVPKVLLTQAEEDRMYRKVDLHLMPTVAILYLLSFMDRGNIGNARLSGLEDELGMSSQQYNLALSLFFVTYCLFEVPSNLLLKRCRPSWYIGGICCAWAIVMTCMGVVKSFSGLLVCRLLLGVTEAGLFPGIILLLSIYYPRHKSQIRVGFFFGAATLAGAFSGLLAYGIGFMDGVGGYRGWRWIFILEGLATLVFGIITIFILPPYPHQVRWLTEDERAWLLYKKAIDSGSAGEAEEVSKKYVWQALGDWQCWLSLGHYMGVVVPLYAISLFAPTLIQSFNSKYTRPQVQLLSVPIYVAALIFVLTVSFLGDKWKSRFPFMMVCLVLCLVGHVINIAPTPSGVKYFGLFLIACGAYGGLPTTVTWLSNNLSGQVKRGTGSAFQIGIGNLAALASTNVYRTQDKPRYILGHGVVIAFICLGLVCAPAYAAMLKRANTKKERMLALPEGERRVYTVEELRDLGDRAPEFKYTI